MAENRITHRVPRRRVMDERQEPGREQLEGVNGAALCRGTNMNQLRVYCLDIRASAEVTTFCFTAVMNVVRRFAFIGVTISPVSSTPECRRKILACVWSCEEEEEEEEFLDGHSLTIKGYFSWV